LFILILILHIRLIFVVFLLAMLLFGLLILEVVRGTFIFVLFFRVGSCIFLDFIFT